MVGFPLISFTYFYSFFIIRNIFSGFFCKNKQPLSIPYVISLISKALS